MGVGTSGSVMGVIRPIHSVVVPGKRRLIRCIKIDSTRLGSLNVRREQTGELSSAEN